MVKESMDLLELLRKRGLDQGNRISLSEYQE